MEEIKLTQNVHNEALSADVSGMVQTLSCVLKRQMPSFSCLQFPKYLDLTITNWSINLHSLGHSRGTQKDKQSKTEAARTGVHASSNPGESFLGFHSALGVSLHK